MDELALLHGAATPKRKRPHEVPELSPKESANPPFSFRPGGQDGSINRGSPSPRSKMARQFRGLALESGGVAGATATTNANNSHDYNYDSDCDCDNDYDHDYDHTYDNTTVAASPGDAAQVECIGHGVFDDMYGSHVNGLAVRKRQKSSPTPTEETTPPSTSAFAMPAPVPVVDIPNMATAQPAGRRPSLQRALPSINRLATPKYRTPTPPGATPANEDPKPQPQPQPCGGKKRSGAPQSRVRVEAPGIVSPATTPEDSAEENDDEDELLRIVDPLRASLTWHEDEITVYDPEDSEDDGEGIDGIGFKPSQPVAEARAAKRRQQLAEYRRREASEARDHRSRRRAAAAAAAAAAAVNIPPLPPLGRMGSGDDARKVRFRETEPACALVTN